MLLAQISLNLSFIIYMFLYLPQVIHNQRQADLEGLSKWMHVTLYLAYFLDLLYGFGNNFPWQYRAVSAAGWLLLNVQHFQFIYYFKQQHLRVFQNVFYIIFLCTGAILLLGLRQHSFTKLTLLSYFGYISQLGFAFAYIPQILKSRRLQSAQAMSFLYVLLGLILAIFDCISAYQLNWGWANKAGSVVIIILTSILLMQQYHYVAQTKLTQT
jgi:uncharacterized protein with PQ loop repeat